MRPDTNDNVYCFICDWFAPLLVLFLLFVIAAASHSSWLPLITRATPAAVPATLIPKVAETSEALATSPAGRPTLSALAPTGTSAPDEPSPTPSPSAWQIFQDKDIGYQISYPPDWTAFPSEGAPGGAVSSRVKLTPCSSCVTYDQFDFPQESAAMVISVYPSAGQPFEEWVVQSFPWVSGPVEPGDVNNFRAFKAAFSPEDQPGNHYQITWLDLSGSYLMAWGISKTGDNNSSDLIDQILGTIQKMK